MEPLVDQGHPLGEGRGVLHHRRLGDAGRGVGLERQILQGRIAVEGLGPVKHQLRPELSQRSDQILEVVADTDQLHLVVPPAQRVGDLVFHLGLILMPSLDFPYHLPLVVGRGPAFVWSIEDHRDAHRNVVGPGRLVSWQGPLRTGRADGIIIQTSLPTRWPID
ncbi:MAG: hypothetical protein ACREMG_08430 [Gemmatimonadales bacterium]